MCVCLETPAEEPSGAERSGFCCGTTGLHGCVKPGSIAKLHLALIDGNNAVSGIVYSPVKTAAHDGSAGLITTEDRR